MRITEVLTALGVCRKTGLFLQQGLFGLGKVDFVFARMGAMSALAC